MKSDMEKIDANRPPDLRQVAVLSNSDWLRIQDSVNGVNKHNQSLIEAREEREALHVRSKEVVKHWSNTIAVSINICLNIFPTGVSFREP